MSYCDFVKDLAVDNVHRKYHDTEYGFAITCDNELFGRLILEINQAGLSWDTILKKRDNFRSAYDDFHIHTIAHYSEEKIQELLNDAGIIRNKLKVHAAIFNAKAILRLQQEFGSFKHWLDLQEFKDKQTAVKIFKKHFTFVGGEIVNEFLMSTGYLHGAHIVSCSVYEQINLRKER